MTQPLESRSPASLADVVRDLRKLSRSDDESTSRKEHLLRLAFEIGDTNPRRVTDFLVRYLLPMCLSDDRTANQGVRIHSQQLRELLKDWLDGLPDEVLRPVRTALVRRIVAHLAERGGTAALYCLASIGHRSPATLKALKSVGQRDDPDGHEAIRLFLNFGVSKKERNWARRRLLETPEAQRTDAWYTAATLFHEAAWLNILIDRAVHERHSFLGISRLAWVAEEAPGDRLLQDNVWSAIMDVVRRRDDGWATLLFTGGLFERCNTPAVLSTLLDNMAAVSALGGVHVMRFIDRLQDARTTTQLDGWQGHDRVALEGMLLPYVQRSTGGDTVSRTIESDTKEKALEALLCSATPLVDSLARTAVEGESSGYTTADALDRLACFSASSIPERARAALLMSPAIDRSGSSNSPLAVFMASARFVASSLNLESLRLLLNSAGGADGHPYRQQVRGAARLADWLSARGDNGVLPALLEAVNSPSLVAQTIAVSSIARILGHERSTTELRERLRAVARDEARQPYIRTEAIAGLLDNPSGESMGNFFEELSKEPDPELKRLAFCGLIMQGRLESCRSQCELFAFAPPTSETDTSGAYVAGMLAATEPGHYEARATAFIERGSDWTMHAFVMGYRYDRTRPLERSREINQALVRKVLLNETEQRANPTFFADLALIAPREFLEQRWEDVWYNWMPDSRVSIADAIPLAAANDESTNRAEHLLTLLIVDDVFAVRRSAARALANVNMIALASWCDQALESRTISRRRVAAEAAGWLPVDSEATIDNKQLRTAADDPERTVRSASAKAREALRFRSWSAELRKRVVALASDPNEWVLQSYAASRALSHIGDDADIDELRALAAERTTPPNVAYWLSRTAEAIQESWKDRTAKWPGEWLPWQGALEQVDATLSVLNQSLDVRATLWLRRGDPGREPNAWGGVARVREGQGYSLWFGGGSGGAALTIPGRNPVTVLLVATDGTKMVFRGNDQYPEPLRHA